jgi:hypothetical protein
VQSTYALLNWQVEHPTLLSNSVVAKVHCTVNIKVLGNTGTYIVPWVSVIVGTNTDISDSGQGNHIMQCFPEIYMCMSVILCKIVFIILPVCYLSMYCYAAEFIIVKNRCRRWKK